MQKTVLFLPPDVYWPLAVRRSASGAHVVPFETLVLWYWQFFARVDEKELPS